MNTAIERVDLSFAVEQQGNRKRYLPTGGRIVFRQLSGVESRGDWMCPEPDNPITAVLTAEDLRVA